MMIFVWCNDVILVAGYLSSVKTLSRVVDIETNVLVAGYLSSVKTLLLV